MARKQAETDMGMLDKGATAAGVAALSICESLIALADLKVIGAREAHAILADAAATHRNAIALSLNPGEHRAAAALIEEIIHGRAAAQEPVAGLGFR
jgi:hypothetical protein